MPHRCTVPRESPVRPSVLRYFSVTTLTRTLCHAEDQRLASMWAGIRTLRYADVRPKSRSIFFPQQSDLLDFNRVQT